VEPRDSGSLGNQDLQRRSLLAAQVLCTCSGRAQPASSRRAKGLFPRGDPLKDVVVGRTLRGDSSRLFARMFTSAAVTATTTATTYRRWMGRTTR
jgi:hypothetical protein